MSTEDFKREKKIILPLCNKWNVYDINALLRNYDDIMSANILLLLKILLEIQRMICIYI